MINNFDINAASINDDASASSITWAVSPIVEARGGFRLSLYVDSTGAGVYSAHIGSTGTVADTRCPQAIGVTQGSNMLGIWTPLLPVGGPYILSLWRQSGSGPSSFISAPAVIVNPDGFNAQVFNLRRVWSLFKQGPLSLGVVRFPQR